MGSHCTFDDHKGLIHAVYSRHSLLERTAVGKTGEKQLIASNIVVGWIVQSLNRDFSLNRLERYITICYSAGIAPMILLSKVDLVEAEELDKTLLAVRDRFKDIPVIAFSKVWKRSSPGCNVVRPIAYCALPV